jgi:hypothetical protein
LRYLSFGDFGLEAPVYADPYLQVRRDILSLATFWTLLHLATPFVITQTLQKNMVSTPSSFMHPEPNGPLVKQRITGDIFLLESLGAKMVIVSSLKRTNDLFDKRSNIYSDRPWLPMMCGEWVLRSILSDTDFMAYAGLPL